jgi:hypothetical protein
MNLNSATRSAIRQPRIFDGWYIVGVGFLSRTVRAFDLSSTLSVFVKPLTEDLGVTRGPFAPVIFDDAHRLACRRRQARLY